MLAAHPPRTYNGPLAIQLIDERRRCLSSAEIHFALLLPHFLDLRQTAIDKQFDSVHVAAVVRPKE